ncbi:nuclear transport factor 2 family protein [Calothrix anomala]|uniref:Nuclear transport factor 2 family protein n=1 Tax=Calothrix anomala FACHB-343 TaxID=2692894 RepID=A0ABR8B4T9_9CYAN|nr:nuclear transport factor 2 family protein [Calothrix anomala]MBD2228102.1 nuclear transport factor 2 family protein [Calothrix anomala FACHB-343]
MTSENHQILEITKNYLKDIAEGKTADELAIYYSESVKQIEYPNRLFPEGATRNLNDLKEAFLRGKSVLISQNYDIQRSYVVGNTVILETILTAEIAVPIGQTPAGGKMKAYFAQFIEFEDGKIICQRTYDCFEPF